MTMTVYGSGKYFNRLQTIELRITLGNNGGVTVLSIENDLAVVSAKVPYGEKNWARWAGDTLDALGRHWMAQNDYDCPSDALIDAWHDATAVVWHRALFGNDRTAAVI